MAHFRDSWLIRIGAAIIALVIAAVILVGIAFFIFGHNPDVGPAAIWAFFWIIVGGLLIAVGIGQTIVRRRDRRA